MGVRREVRLSKGDSRKATAFAPLGSHERILQAGSQGAAGLPRSRSQASEGTKVRHSPSMEELTLTSS